MGFIETPYRKVNNRKVDIKSEPIYLSAEEEEEKLIAQSNVRIDKNGKIIDDMIIARMEGDFPVIESNKVHYTDVAPNQIASISASLIIHFFVFGIPHDFCLSKYRILVN